jgi:16S rRNA (adenine1518-N6/adenine1519-N6)-dimethyltransferase
MVLLVQREVAERLVAAPGTRTYGALSVGVQIRARVRVAFAVGRRAFRPVPRVDSCAVVIERAEVPPAAADLEKLRIMTRVCFSRRRKQIGTILRTAPEFRLPRERLPEILGQEGIDPKARPETLSPAQFLALARRLERF